MGQKLATIKFEPGSTPDLWSSKLNPEFVLEVSDEDEINWVRITEYFPELSGEVRFPVNTENVQQLSSSIFQRLISKNQRLSFLTDDSMVRWRVLFQDNFLTNGEIKLLTSGTF